MRSADFKFYQQRDLGLDLYFAGWPAVLIGVALIASVLVFLLAIFHVIPRKRHVVTLLLGLGVAAAAAGLALSYVHAAGIEQYAPKLVHEAAGTAPQTSEQLAAIVALPLVVGAITLTLNVLGCLYMGIFWSGDALTKSRER